MLTEASCRKILNKQGWNRLKNNNNTNNMYVRINWEITFVMHDVIFNTNHCYKAVIVTDTLKCCFHSRNILLFWCSYYGLRRTNRNIWHRYLTYIFLSVSSLIYVYLFLLQNCCIKIYLTKQLREIWGWKTQAEAFKIQKSLLENFSVV